VLTSIITSVTFALAVFNGVRVRTHDSSTLLHFQEARCLSLSRADRCQCAALICLMSVLCWNVHTYPRAFSCNVSARDKFRRERRQHLCYGKLIAATGSTAAGRASRPGVDQLPGHSSWRSGVTGRPHICPHRTSAPPPENYRPGHLHRTC